MTERELLAGDLLTACTLLAQEKELADAAADLLTILKRRPKYADDRPAMNAWMARYREARGQ